MNHRADPWSIQVAHVVIGVELSMEELSFNGIPIPAFDPVQETLAGFGSSNIVITENFVHVGIVVLSNENRGYESVGEQAFSKKQFRNIKKKLKKALQPLNLWDETTFRVHLVTD
ncbi:hypothetical protein HN958_02460 [Candidatus Falkowbacteria bacterium]|jgi:hypothetical protein|nr:hypothetical protein [Candidatus Falkowbacteria bacterium]MBT7007344.1 hypothetical protein [Candidatus Falkowbacteria bacterium]